MKSLKFITTLFVAAVLIFSACEKPTEPDEETAKDMANGAYIVSDAFAISSNHSNKKGTLDYPSCVSAEWNATHDSLFITFDDDCEVNGVKRSGQLICTYSGEWGVGITLSITFNDYFVNGEAISGSIAGTYNSEDKGTRNFTVTATDMKVTLTDGKTFSWSSSKTFNMVKGMLTFLNPTDDVYEMTGTSNGINKKGETYASASSDLRKEYGCKLPVSGTVTITKEGDTPIEINFDHDGNADCDTWVKLTQNGISIDVQL